MPSKWSPGCGCCGECVPNPDLLIDISLSTFDYDSPFSGIPNQTFDLSTLNGSWTLPLGTDRSGISINLTNGLLSGDTTDTDNFLVYNAAVTTNFTHVTMLMAEYLHASGSAFVEVFVYNWLFENFGSNLVYWLMEVYRLEMLSCVGVTDVIASELDTGVNPWVTEWRPIGAVPPSGEPIQAMYDAFTGGTINIRMDV